MAKKKKFSSEELSGFCSQVAIMLKSGIALEEGVYMLAEEVEEEGTKKVLNQVQNKLKHNESFESALRDTGVFPEYLVNMVRIGETSGKLEDVMNSMEQYYARDSVIKDSIRNVIAYPAMMFGMIAVVLAALVGKILPMFENVFINLNVDAASSSSRIMNFGMWAGRIVALFAFAVIVVGLIVYGFYHTEKGNLCLRRFACHCFITKRTANLLAVGRFVSSMAVMVSSGLDVKESMEMSRGIVEHPGVQKKISRCIEKMDKKESFANTLRDEAILTGMQGRIVAVADKAGMMDEVLGDISTQFDEKISNHMGQFCTKVETSLVLALSVVVGGVLISIMFPLVSIITSIG